MMRWGLAICALLLAISWLASNHYPPWVAAHSEVLAIAAVAALNVAGLKKIQVGISVQRPVLFLLIVSLIPLIQVACGKVFFFGDAWIATLYLCCTAWAALWSARAFQLARDRWLACFTTALSAGALLSSIIAIIQSWKINVGPLALFIAAVPPGHAPFANLAQPNQLETLLAMGLGSMIFMYERRWLPAPAALAGACVITFSMAMAQSRTGLLLLGTALVWHFVYAIRLKLRTPRGVVYGFVAGWAVVFALWPRLAAAMGLSPIASLAERVQPGPRLVIWSQLWDALWLHPLTGFGWNQVSVAQMAVSGDFARSRMTEHAHNLLLDLALWNGLPLAALLVGLAAWWLVRAIRAVRSIDGAFAALVIGMLLAHAMVEFPLDYLYFLVPFGMALGILMTEVQAPLAFVMSLRSAAFATAVFVSTAAFAAIDYWHVEEAYRNMRFSVARIGRQTSLPPAVLETQFTQLAAFYRFALMQPWGRKSPQELEFMRQVALRFGYSTVLYRYALAQVQNGDPAGARLTMLQMRQLHGERPYAEAKAELIELKPQHPELARMQLP